MNQPHPSREIPHRATVKITLTFVAIVIASGCGGGGDAAGPRTAADDEPPPVTPTPTGALRRAEVDAVLDAGLPRFLQGVEVEPVVEEGAFVGFLLVALYPGDPRFADAPVRPGDVILSINGQSIERPEQAHEVWESVRVASEVVISFRRDGEPGEARLAILE